MKKETGEKPCMVPNCDKKAAWKGICQSCYGQAKRLIESGETTWEDLCEMGLCRLTDRPLLTEFLRLKWQKEHPGEIAPKIDPDSPTKIDQDAINNQKDEETNRYWKKDIDEETKKVLDAN